MLERIEAALKVLLTIALILFLISLTGVIRPTFELARAWQTPLGPKLELPTQTPAPNNVPDTTITQTRPQTQAINACGSVDQMTILAIGADTRGDNYMYGLADVIRIVRVDFVNGKISVLEFPRDLWVEIPEISDHYGITHEKLNQAYLYGNPGFGYYKGADQGPGLLAKTLQLNFGLEVEHYVAVNMHTFERMIDAVGGIDVYLPHAVDARQPDQKERRDLVFAQGDHHLAGKEALMLARIRIGGVFDRASNQNIILCGLRQKLLSPRIITKIPNLIDTFDGAIQTDFSPEELSQFACLAPSIGAEDITFYSFPEEIFTGTRVYDKIFDSNVFVWNADYNVMRMYVQAFINDTWQIPYVEASTPPPSELKGFACP
jgi:LCP family protein required for cell wall assembly